MVPPSRRGARGKEQTTLEDTNVTGSHTDFSVHFEETPDAFEVFEDKFPTYNWNVAEAKSTKEDEGLLQGNFRRNLELLYSRILS